MTLTHKQEVAVFGYHHIFTVAGRDHQNPPPRALGSFTRVQLSSFPQQRCIDFPATLFMCGFFWLTWVKVNPHPVSHWESRRAGWMGGGEVQSLKQTSERPKSGIKRSQGHRRRAYKGGSGGSCPRRVRRLSGAVNALCLVQPGWCGLEGW